MRVRWTLPALANLESIQTYVAQYSPPAADRLVNDILDRTEALLSQRPQAGRKGRVNGTRELVLSGTAYVVAYRVRTDVEILAVMHGAQEWPEILE